MIANETLGYYIGRTYLFLIRAGCIAKHVRFRYPQQNQPDCSSRSSEFVAPTLLSLTERTIVEPTAKLELNGGRSH